MSDSNLGMGLHPHRMEIEAQLEVQSPLHVGSGDFQADLLPENDTGAAPKLATLLFTENGNPFLPGSTLKGLLRSLAGDQADAWFGSIKKDEHGSIKKDEHGSIKKDERGSIKKDERGSIKKDERGSISHIFVWGSECKVPDTSLTNAPYQDALKDRKTFAAARTQIDDETGTADDHKLFFQEMLPPKTEIPLRIMLVADSIKELDEILKKAIIPIFSKLKAGAYLGKGKSNGQGRIELKDWRKISITQESLTKDGTIRKTKKNDIPKPLTIIEDKNLPSWTIILKCTGPFVILDSSAPHRKCYIKGLDPALNSQTLHDDKPYIPGSSLMGVLRSRAEWFQKIEENRGKKTQASIVNVLFGTTPNQGKLHLKHIKIIKSSPFSITSVKLDRVSAGPIDGALFTTRAYCNVQAEAKLRLETNDSDTADFLKRFLEFLEEDGLMLGHGGNKGFGWFTVKKQGM